MRRDWVLWPVAMAVALALGAGPSAAQAPDEGRDALSRIVTDWLAAPHGDYGSESFTHWNEEGAVPTACAACHSQPGLIDYLGADGSAAGTVEHPAAVNAPIGCAACHNTEAHALDAVRFPSGVTVDGLGASAVCAVCHQGRQSVEAVERAVAELDADAVVPDLGFLNIHYGVAAAVLHGADVRGGYQYPGKRYAGRFAHAGGLDNCTACHEPHSTRVETEGCLSCHRGVESLRDIRMQHRDFDGDGDIAGGIHAEIAGLHGRLYAAIRAYGQEVAGAPIGYAAGSYPYFFADSDGDGRIGPEEAIYPNRYQSWTPRLLKAAYNYQAVAKDPGGYVHNPRYLLQLLHDSLESLAQRVELEMGGVERP